MGKSNKIIDTPADLYATGAKPVEELAKKLDEEMPTSTNIDEPEEEEAEEQAAQIVALNQLLREREQTISDQEATIESLMQAVGKMVEEGKVNPDRLIEHEGKTYKLCSPAIVALNRTHTAESLMKNPKAIEEILAGPEQTHLTEA